MEAIELYDLVAEDPKLQEVLSTFVREERTGRQKDYFLGLEWFQVQTNAKYLNSLVTHGLLRVEFKSNNTTAYVLNDLEMTDKVLRKLRGEVVDLELTEPEERLPEDFLDTLVGYDDLKELILRSLNAEKPLHVLLIGPPASGKSIVLSEIGRMPRSRFALGGSSTKAGITQLVADQRPRYLIIDEIDKAMKSGLPIDFVCRDIFDSGIKEKFDVAYCLGYTFLYMTTDSDIRRFFKAVRNMLIPGGLFLVDFINGLSLSKDFDKDEFVYQHKDTTIRQHDRWSLDKRKEVKHLDFEYEITDSEGRVQRISAEEDLRIFFDDDVQVLLSGCGFTSIESFGDYTLERKAANDPYIVIVSGKKI